MTTNIILNIFRVVSLRWDRHKFKNIHLGVFETWSWKINLIHYCANLSDSANISDAWKLLRNCCPTEDNDSNSWRAILQLCHNAKACPYGSCGCTLGISGKCSTRLLRDLSALSLSTSTPRIRHIRDSRQWLSPKTNETHPFSEQPRQDHSFDNSLTWHTTRSAVDSYWHTHNCQQSRPFPWPSSSCW